MTISRCGLLSPCREGKLPERGNTLRTRTGAQESSRGPASGHPGLRQDDHEMYGRGKNVNYTSGENIEIIMDAVIERISGRRAGTAAAWWTTQTVTPTSRWATPPKPVVVKTEGEKRGHKKAPMSVNERQDSPDLFSAPQHFTANAKTRKKKKPQDPEREKKKSTKEKKDKDRDKS